MFTARTEFRTIAGLTKSREISEVNVYFGDLKIGRASDPNTVQADLDHANSIGLSKEDLQDYHAAATKAEKALGNRDLLPLLWDTHQVVVGAA
ncbi:hypothetical protein [uncultured Thiodictyon sp.]|uniref:hypothetical protein n=1 Tax=uncultured Thiodictyon sp. TaxID=1846217 RepID=UPI0025CF7665|nr:hypothetical protein [uncultured Thiodictyon sp.]